MKKKLIAALVILIIVFAVTVLASPAFAASRWERWSASFLSLFSGKFNATSSMIISSSINPDRLCGGNSGKTCAEGYTCKFEGMLVGGAGMCATAPKIVRNASSTLACVAAAAEKRDNAMIVAVDVYVTSVKTALVARRDALKAAWAITEQKARQTAIKNAWNKYKDALKTARETFRKAKNVAWDLYKTERKACGTNATMDDMTDSSVDLTL
jgi:hypothetical protein